MDTSDVAVVTGANSGIGRATALHLAQHGYTVYGTVRSVDRATKLLAEAETRGVTVELTTLGIADDESVAAGVGERAEQRIPLLAAVALTEHGHAHAHLAEHGVHLLPAHFVPRAERERAVHHPTQLGDVARPARRAQRCCPPWHENAATS